MNPVGFQPLISTGTRKPEVGSMAYKAAVRKQQAKERKKLTSFEQMTSVGETGAPTLSDIATLARHSLLAYAIMDKPDFIPAPHLQRIAAALEAVTRGEIKRLLIEAPPRHGKSFLVSDIFPKWYLGHHPNHQVIFSTYGQEFASRFGRKVGEGLKAPQHIMAFPDGKVKQRGFTQNYFEMEGGGEYMAVGAGGSLTGRGAHLLIMDDLIKNYEEASSEIYREKLWDWYESTAKTRLMPGGAIISMQTRWMIDDLTGRLRDRHANEGWHIITLPAMDKDDNPLWPEAFDKKALLQIRENVDPKIWWSLYMQQPTVGDGAIFRRDKFWMYEQPPESFEMIFQSWDTAFKTGSLNDYSVCQTWGVAHDGYYLLDQWRGRLEYDQLIVKAMELASEWNCWNLLIEDAASGQSMIQTLRNNTRMVVLPVKPYRAGRQKEVDYLAVMDKDEVHGAEAYALMISSGKMKFPKGAPWMRDHLDEHCAYDGGNSGHDDQVKCGMVFASYINNNGIPDFTSYRGIARDNRTW